MSEVTGIWLRRVGLTDFPNVVLEIDHDRLYLMAQDTGLVFEPLGFLQTHLVKVVDDYPRRYMRSLRGRWYDPTPEELSPIEPWRVNMDRYVVDPTGRLSSRWYDETGSRYAQAIARSVRAEKWRFEGYLQAGWDADQIAHYIETGEQPQL